MSQYILYVSNNYAWSTSVLQVLIEYLQQVHQDRWNAGKISDPFQVVNIVKARVQLNLNVKIVIVH